SSSQFESSVRYLFEKQLAEAELIVLSKSELLNPEEVGSLTEQLQTVAGRTPTLLLSAKTGAGVNEWVDRLLSASPVGNALLDLDYEIYGQAEASLGWLNATVDLASAQEFPLTELGEAVVAKIQEQCRVVESPIAHLKILFVAAGRSDRIALTTRDSHAAWDGEGNLGHVRKASAVINARVAAHPEELRRVVEDSLQAAAREQGVSATVRRLEPFAPAPPKRPVFQASD